MTIMNVAVKNSRNDPEPIVVTFHDETVSAVAYLSVEEAQNFVTEVAAGISRRKHYEAQHAEEARNGDQ